MIKIDKGTVEITGSFPTIMSQLSIVAHHMYHNILTKEMGMSHEEAKKSLLSAIEDGCLSQEEVHAKAAEALERILKHPGIMMDMLMDILTRKDDK